MPFISFDTPAPASAGGFIDFNAPEKPADTGNFMRGAKVAAGQTIPLAKGLVGAVGAVGENVFGEGGAWTEIKDWGEKGAADGMAKLEPLSRPNDDVTVAWGEAKKGNLNALIDWGTYALGYGTVQLGEAALTGGVGAIAAKSAAKAFAKTAVEKMVEKQSAKIAATEAGKILTAEQLMARATAQVADRISLLGAGTALAGYTETQEVGSIYPEAVKEARDKGQTLTGSDLARVWGMGTLAAATETATDLLGLGALAGKIRIPGKMGLAARVGTGAAVG